MPRYIPTIGLEVHVQLKTRSKMFCGCPAEYGAEPNTHTCPVCLGYPGALPVMNGEALKMTALAGLMLGCDIAPKCKFDRKNYFYPDMPKNYQITQMAQPICIGGGVPLHEFAYPKDVQKNIASPGKVVKLTRIHLEEDVAKSTHFDANSGIDFNRAGTPLMEIVSEPDIATPEEAFAYLTALQRILLLSGVSDADMEMGQLRCDCNISVRPEGQKELGVKIEIKNMNSTSAVRRAIAYEIARQIEACERGEKLVQSTRGWDDAASQTRHQRTKESSHDYRYFPDPDLLPVDTTAFMPEVETQYEQARARIDAPRLQEEYYAAMLNAAIRGGVESSLTNEYDALLRYFNEAVQIAPRASVWFINSLLPALTGAAFSITRTPVSAVNLGELVTLVDCGKISSTKGKEVFAEMFSDGKAAAQIVKERGLEQVSDTGAIEALCRQVMDANPKAVGEYKAGKLGSINFLKGQVLKLSQGKANPQVVNDLLAKLLA